MQNKIYALSMLLALILGGMAQADDVSKEEPGWYVGLLQTLDSTTSNRPDLIENKKISSGFEFHLGYRAREWWGIELSSRETTLHPGSNTAVSSIRHAFTGFGGNLYLPLGPENTVVFKAKYLRTKLSRGPRSEVRTSGSPITSEIWGGHGFEMGLEASHALDDNWSVALGGSYLSSKIDVASPVVPNGTVNLQSSALLAAVSYENFLDVTTGRAVMAGLVGGLLGGAAMYGATRSVCTNNFQCDLLSAGLGTVVGAGVGVYLVYEFE